MSPVAASVDSEEGEEWELVVKMQARLWGAKMEYCPFDVVGGYESEWSEAEYVSRTDGFISRFAFLLASLELHPSPR